MSDCDSSRIRKELVAAFTAVYGQPPSAIVRCPGRVNLIGEHIDYNGYGVLPMAIEQSVYAAVLSCETSTLTLNNTDAQYESFARESSDVSVDRAHPAWHQYFLCGYRGIIEHLHLQPQHIKGMSVLVRGQVPPSAGLSSSSALVCAAVLATLYAQTAQAFEKVDRTTVAEVAAACERFIGTQGGGMDQAICILAQQNMAKQIDFNPLRAENVRLPECACFVVCHSCAEMNKAASTCFNERVLESRLGTKVIAHSKGLSWMQIRTPGELHSALDKNRTSLDEMCVLVTNTLHEHAYTKHELCSLLGVSPSQLEQHCFTENTMHMQSFHLQSRLLHTFTEASRVQEFVSECNQPNTDIERLGGLMNASHQSCACMYMCSCNELDELVIACRESGALGSRLTGAGWGGCTVSLIEQHNLQSFIQGVKSRFYDRVPTRKKQYDTGLCVFASKPALGAEVTLIQ